MNGPNLLRIVLLGKTGSGKSSLANTVFGTQDFKVKHFTDSEAFPCQEESGSVRGRNLTLVDTPGFFHSGWSEKQLKDEVVSCVSRSAPGPHVFLIVLKVEKFTNQELQVVRRIQEYFSADVFRFSVVVFTHGDQLSEQKIEEFVCKNWDLRDLVEKCGGRCHVVDNKYWRSDQQDQYRSNQFQVAQLINTIERMVMENRGDHYTMNMLKRQQPGSGIFEFLKKSASRKNLKFLFGITLFVGVFVFWRKVTERAVAIN